MQGDYFNQTLLHPVGLGVMLVLGILMLLVPRRYALIPMLVMACAVSSAQRFVLFTLDFDLLRMMVLFGWARIVLLGENRGFRWKAIDSVFVLWIASGFLFSTIREGTMSNVVLRLGFTYDAAGIYFLFRMLVREWRDVETFILAAAVLSVPITAVFLIEQATGRNMFAVFGGVSPITEVRQGRIRCRGPFSHPIYAGCFWASLLPCFFAIFWRCGGWRRWAGLALPACAVLIVTTASSTPLLAIVAAMFAVLLYPLRTWMPYLRWLTAGGLLVLHLVMQAPVWHLVARVDVLAGSTGWYRYKLIDGFIRNVHLWWFDGTRAYEQLWGPTYKAVTNHYILQGVEGGAVTLAFFVAIIVLAFRGVGRMLRVRRATPARRLLAWGLGAALFVHCLDFIAVSYFGQVLMLFYGTLAIIASLSPDRASARRAIAVRPVSPETHRVARRRTPTRPHPPQALPT